LKYANSKGVLRDVNTKKTCICVYFCTIYYSTRDACSNKKE